MFAVTTFSNGKSDPSPAARVCMYLSALRASSPRTAYSTLITAGLILSAVRAGCREKVVPFGLDILNDRICVCVRVGIQLVGSVQRGIGERIPGCNERRMNDIVYLTGIESIVLYQSRRVSGRFSPVI